MRLCLPDESKIERYKENRMTNFEELSDYFSMCVEKELDAELCEYLQFCEKKHERLEKLSKQIISSNLYSVRSCNDSEIAKFHSFIRQTFMNVEAVSEFIEEVFSTPEYLDYVYGKLEHGCFDGVINVSDRFPTSTKNLIEKKRAFLDYYFCNLKRRQFTGFDALEFTHFLKWCSSNETTVSEFKQSLNIDDIFEIIVDNQ